MPWHEIKGLLLSIVPLSFDAAHIHIGLAIFLVFAILLRCGFAMAWFVLLVVTLGNEIFDISDSIILGEEIRWRDAVKDIFNTMAWPSILFSIDRRRGGTDSRAPLRSS